MLILAAPIALQNLITTLLNMIDIVMVGKLGDSAIASLGIANQVFFLFTLIIFGVNGGASIFTSQFWGKKDIKNIRKTLALSVISGLIVSVVFLVIVLITAGNIINLFNPDKTVFQLSYDYLLIVAFSYPLTAVTIAFGFSARSINQAVFPMVISAISIGINAFLNYLLIFGYAGFPALGVKGAALATLIARLLEMLIMISFIYYRNHILKFSWQDVKDLTEDFIKTIYKRSTPVILNEAFWALGMIAYTVAYSQIGTQAIAATQVAITVQNLFMVISIGMAHSCAIMLGNEIGANQEDIAIDYARKFSFTGLFLGAFIGLILYLSIPYILDVFNASLDLQEEVTKILTVIAAVMSLKTLNIILILGILRSGGDNKFSLYLELASVWLVGVPLAFWGASLRLPVHQIVLLVTGEEIVKCIIGYIRVASRKWVNNIVAEM